MPLVTNRGLRLGAVLAVSAFGLTACATQQYVDEQIAGVNARITSLEGRIGAAESGAQAAAGDARTANQRLDQLTTRVDTLEQRAMSRAPRN